VSVLLYLDIMDTQALFSQASAISTREVAAFFSISEADARTWADELDVSRVGPSFAWTIEDVEALAAELDTADDADDADDDGDTGDDDEETEDDDADDDEEGENE
jgi:hypothetical protein